MESRDVLKIHGALRRYCTSRVSLRSTLEVQYLLNLPCIFNTSLDSMLYLLIIPIGYWHTSQVCSSQLFVTFFYVLGSIDKAYNYFQQPTYKNVTYDLYYNLKSNTKN